MVARDLEGQLMVGAACMSLHVDHKRAWFKQLPRSNRANRRKTSVQNLACQSCSRSQRSPKYRGNFLHGSICFTASHCIVHTCVQVAGQDQ